MSIEELEISQLHDSYKAEIETLNKKIASYEQALPKFHEMDLENSRLKTENYKLTEENRIFKNELIKAREYSEMEISNLKDRLKETTERNKRIDAELIKLRETENQNLKLKSDFMKAFETCEKIKTERDHFETQYKERVEAYQTLLIDQMKSKEKITELTAQIRILRDILIEGLSH